MRDHAALVALHSAIAVLDSLLQPIAFCQVAMSLFIAVLFIQSGFDKVFNYSATLGWLLSHFGKSPLRNHVGIMLAVITAGEILAGGLALTGAVQLIVSGEKSLAMYGAQVASLNVLALFMGQRIAKDYVGAASLVAYFIVCIGAVLVLGL